MVKEMSQDEWQNLIQDADRTCSFQYAMDRVAQTAFTLLDECYPEQDHVDILQSLSHAHGPLKLTTAQNLRLTLLLLNAYVQKGKYHLQRDFEKEDEEAMKVWRDCIAALRPVKETTSEPNNENLHTAERKDATQSSATKKRSDFDKKKSSINSIKLKRRKIERHVTWHDKLPSSSNTHLADSDIDQQKAQNHVDRIWEQAEESNYILAKVYGFNITDVDIKSLKRGKWLTDQVMDSYLACLAQKELDKGVKVKHEVVSTMTNIINDTHVVNTGKKSRVMEYDFIVGAYHQRGGHWDLVIVEPKRGAVFFYNPLGETSCQLRRAINSWRNYVNKTLVYKTSWHLETKDHAQQQDSCNCGVYCLMFAERHLTGETLLSISRTDVESKRREIAHTFLLYEVYMEKQCPCCGFETTNEDQNNILQCQTCDRVFHKKNHCVGEQMASAVGVPFRCKVCSLV